MTRRILGHEFSNPMSFFYDFIFFLFALFYFPYALLAGKWHPGFLRRWGNFSKELSHLAGKNNIWIHAVSVGEVVAVSGLVQKIKEQFPAHGIVLSSVTRTGYELACARFQGTCAVLYAPLDFSWVVRKYIRAIDPRIYIAVETEIWPNLLRHLFARRVPVVLVNGRISDKSFGRYQALRFLLGNILRQVDMFCMQSSRDAERIHALGALPERVCVTGSMKFDDKPQAATLRRGDLGLGERERIWVAGSTHPGEDEIVLDVYKKLRREFPDLRLAIAPRHIERVAQIEKLIKDSGFEAVRFSRPSSDQNNAVMVIDIIGHLRSFYQLATIVFMGKSLKVHGGQNIIEPASFAKPVLTGPFTENFADVMRIFLEEQAVIQVSDATELFEQMRRLLQNPQEADGIGDRARDVVERQRGATEKTLDVISRLI